MNTRIQVEHPVTELITGIDLVKAQLLIAAGERLPYSQSDVQIRGHALECRINAEDPKTFMPSPGPIRLWHAPGGPGIRVDSHVYSGYNVPPYYDSLVGKIIAHGDTRDGGLARIAVRDDLADQRIVVGRHVVAGVHVTVDPDAGAAGRVPQPDRPRRGHEGLRVLGVDAAFQGVTADLHVALAIGQPLTRGDQQLRLHEIDAGDELGDGMLDLDARVHLDEVELPVLIEELHGAGAAVADRAARLHAPLAHEAALARRDAGRWRLLEHLLVAPLHRAVALAEVRSEERRVGKECRARGRAVTYTLSV